MFVFVNYCITKEFYQTWFYTKTKDYLFERTNFIYKYDSFFLRKTSTFTEYITERVYLCISN